MSPHPPSRRAVLRGALATGLVAGLGPLAGCGGGAASPVDLVVGGGDAGGVFTKLARLLAGRLVERDVAREVAVELTDGSVENLDLLRSGVVQVAPALADSVVTGPPGLSAVARINQLTLHCLVRDRGPVAGLGDLQGRRVACGRRRSGVADTGRRLFEAAGVEPSEVVDSAAAAAAVSLAGGTIDAMLWWGGRPAPEITAISAVEPLRALDLSGVLGVLNSRVDGVYRRVRLPGRIYGQADVRTLGTAGLLMVRDDLPDAVVAALVDTVAEDGRFLVPQPAEGVPYFVQSALVDTLPVPLHPAAAARYRQRHG